MTTKRRPTLNTTSSKSKLQAHSNIVPRVKITPNELIVKKYYFPVLQEEERHNAFLITRFVSGIRTEDKLGLGELEKMHGQLETLVKCYDKSQTLIKYEISSQLATESEQVSARRVLMHFQGFAFYLLLENQRMLRQHTIKKSFTKKETSRSTKESAKHEGNILKSVKKSSKAQSKVNESHQLNKLSKCLKGMLKKHESKNYKTFLEEMQRRRSDASSQPQRMMDLINNLEKDISSIHQELPQFQDYSKQSIYGLSDLKKKSERNPSKMEPNKIKDKRLSTKFTLCKMEFIRKPKDLQSAKANSNSKNSGKSTSLRNKKCSKTNTSSTPDHHNSKSKSRNEKNRLKPRTEVKKKLIDTQKLYFDDTPEQKQQSKNSLLRSCLRKPEPEPTRSKKKPLKR